ncbi:MAG: twin-arginine translocase TatA/TatE family subunit [Micrococcales bacterium]
MRALFEGPAGLILILIILAVFFGPKLPNAAKGIAQSIKVFRKEIKADEKAEAGKDDKAEDK